MRPVYEILTGIRWLIWGTWWGGLSFYAIVVVPIGTEQIGSVEQGFVTQQVTWWHNVLCGIFAASLLLEAYYRKNRLVYATAFLLAFISILLMAGHTYLTKQMNFQDRSVGSDFYSQHAIYLWITAAEWTVGLTVPFILTYATRTPQPEA